MSETAAKARGRHTANSKNLIPLSAGMMLVSLGVVYGDIGTSPMYTLKAIMSGNGGLLSMETDVVLGALSLIIWTITLITTVKYVLIAMKADNRGEGGIFALFSLVRGTRILVIPAIIGGAALLADGILTPAVTVTSAIEGLRTIDFFFNIIGNSQGIVVAITIVIVSVLFGMQRAGTSSIGKAFGPIMTVWFLFLGIGGIINIAGGVGVLRALNPVRGITFLFNGNLNRAGIMVLGNVFLCTTGAEALYSDMGHVGKPNIYATWPFVKACLILNYLGQGAWIIANNNSAELAAIPDVNPFFEMLPENLRPFAVLLCTLAAIIASQALITGSFSIVSEAIRLNMLPHLRVSYPSDTKGQLYIPLVNTVMWVSCIGVILFFRSSKHMEAAYGLAITVTMLMTTILLFSYVSKRMGHTALAWLMLIFFGAIELTFFLSSLTKFMHGGYVTVLMASVLFCIMCIWRRGTAIERTQSIYLPAREFKGQLKSLSLDESLPFYADNLVFLTNDSSFDHLDRDILYSILDKRPKRAKAYFFLNIKVTNEPDTREFSINDFGTDFIFKVRIRLGFQVEQCVNEYLYQVVRTLMDSGRMAPQHHRYSIYKEAGDVGDFRFVMIRKSPGSATSLSSLDRNVIFAKYFIRTLCGSPAAWYGLENSLVTYEYVPMFTAARQVHTLTYVERKPRKTLSPEDSGKLEKIEVEQDIFARGLDDIATTETASSMLIGGETASFMPLSGDDIEHLDTDGEGQAAPVARDGDQEAPASS